MVAVSAVETESLLSSPDDHNINTEDIIVTNCNKYPMTEHVFFKRLGSEAPNLRGHWAFFSNFEPLTIRVPNWFASLLLRVENIKLKGLLSSIIYDELGRGDLEKIHCVLMQNLVKGLDAWKIDVNGTNPLEPGQQLASEFDDLYFGKMGNDFFVLGSIIAGEVYGGQMAYFMGDEARRQQEVDQSIYEWIFVHEEVEPQHANVSRVMAEILPTSGPDFEAIMQGAQWKRGKFTSWLNEIYRVTYGEAPQTVLA